MPVFLKAGPRKRNDSVGITGTPGTGKKSVAPLVARALNFRLMDLSAFAVENGCADDSPDGSVVDVGKLRRVLRRSRLHALVIFGHLLPSVFRKGELGFVAVLRCEPRALRMRLIARGYDDVKVTENVEAELIGVSLSETLSVFGGRKVREYDSTRVDPARISREIIRESQGRIRRGTTWIDWTARYDSAVKLRSLLSSERTDSAFT